MASRRVRIKGIANIPQRRKTTKTGEQENQEECNSDKSKEIIKDNPSLTDVVNLKDATDETKDTLTINSDDQSSQVSGKDTADNEKDESVELNESVQHILPANNKCVKKKVEECHASVDNEIKDISKERPEKVHRRKFLKPSIRVDALNRNARTRIEDAKIDNENLQGNVNLNEIEISTNNAHTGLTIQKNEPLSGVYQVSINTR